MIKYITSFSFLFFFTFYGNCQLLNVQDSIALKIPTQDSYTTNGISSYIKSHFASDSERVRAAFVWVANTINYDVEQLRIQKLTPENIAPETVLKTRKGVCQGYAELFIKLLKECNMQALLVPGFGRLPDGSITPMSHAWVAASVNNKWWLFDPTWAAGGVVNNQFTRIFSNRYYKVAPEQMIKDHMPFDPLHQFLNYPITANDFYDGRTAINTNKSYFNYIDTLSMHNSLTVVNQTRNIIRRIQNNGIRTDLIKVQLDHLTKSLEGFDTKTGLDAAYNHFNLAIALFNEYGKNKNERFASIKSTAIQPMIDSIYEYIRMARADLETAAPKDESSRKYAYEMKNSIYQFSQRVDQEKAFLKNYLAK